MKFHFKVGQRIKRGLLRGTVVRAYVLPTNTEKSGPQLYDAIMDNGARVKGSRHQFKPVRVQR